MNKLLLKLSKMILKVKEIPTDNATLVIADDLKCGIDVCVEGDNCELEAAPDGEYQTEDKVITVNEGVISSITDKANLEEATETENETENESTEEETKVEETVENDETSNEDSEEKEETESKDETLDQLKQKEEEISNLQSKNDELSAKIDDLQAKIAELDELLSKSQAASAHEAAKKIDKIKNPFKTYFKN